MVIHGNSIVSNGEEKTSFFLLEKKGYQGLVSGEHKGKHWERKSISLLCHTLNKKLKIIFRDYTTIGPEIYLLQKTKLNE